MPLSTRRFARSVARGGVFLTLLLIFNVASQPPVPKLTAGPIRHTGMTVADERVNFPIGRLRKLHLVRPDLFLYPLFYEIYC